MTADTDEELIEFLCEEEHYGEAAEPKPAHNVLPEWYKNLDFEIDAPHNELEVGEEVKTVRSCMSFMDALTTGWIVPIPYDFELEVREGGRVMEKGDDYDFNPIEPHALEQIGGFENPQMPMPTIKFRTPWVISAPEGVSVLITSPMNRFEPRWDGFSGMIEADQYYAEANLPSVWTMPEFSGTIHKGTPLFQVIPFKRDEVVGKGRVREMNTREERKKEKYGELIQNTESIYRKKVWEPKEQARRVDK